MCLCGVHRRQPLTINRKNWCCLYILQVKMSFKLNLYIYIVVRHHKFSPMPSVVGYTVYGICKCVLNFCFSRHMYCPCCCNYYFKQFTIKIDSTYPENNDNWTPEFGICAKVGKCIHERITIDASVLNGSQGGPENQIKYEHAAQFMDARNHIHDSIVSITTRNFRGVDHSVDFF